METMSNHNQAFLATDPKRLTITLPMGQDMRNMSFTKEQQIAAAARRRARSKDHPPGNDYRSARGLYTLKSISSASIITQQSKDIQANSSDSRPHTRLHSRKVSTDKVREVQWQDMEIPSELDILHAGTPDEICNIVQESVDEHRAMQASRRSHLQAIVVRTTITQSRSSEEVGNMKALSESSVSVSSRRANSSLSSDISSARSLGLASTTSLASSEGDSGLLNPWSMYDNPGFILSHEDLSTETDIKANPRRSRDKPLKERGVFKIFNGWKGKDADYRGWEDSRDRDCECTSCFDAQSPKTAVLLACRHRYCSHCFSQLIITSTRSESTFPPKCCSQEIPRKAIRSRLSPKDLALFDQKTLEYAVAVGDRYYCASPECSKWIDVRAAYASEGALRCPHCGSSVCIVCRGQGHGKGQNCPNNSGIITTLQQAKPAGWQKCYHCLTVVELNGGGRHVACRCGAHFCHTCGAPWKTCKCTDDERREIEKRRQRHTNEASSEEAEVRAAIAAVEVAERLVVQERETEEERFAEEARRITAREYERLEAITEFFEYLRETLERVRSQQMLALEKRHSTEMKHLHERENALNSNEANQIEAAERAALISTNEATLQDLHKKHTQDLTSTATRHRTHQEPYLQQPHSQTNSSNIFTLLLRAQEAELTTLRAQHSRAIQKHSKRASQRLEEFDRRISAERDKHQEEISKLATETREKIHADWKWFDAVFLERALMLGEDERRMVLSGGEAPGWVRRG